MLHEALENDYAYAEEPDGQYFVVGAPPGNTDNLQAERSEHHTKHHEHCEHHTFEQHREQAHDFSFDNLFEAQSTPDHEVLMTLKTDICHHAAYNGGKEKKFLRAANGHTRTVRCKEDECGRSVLSAKRKEPVELWGFLVQIALCTLWGSKARSRAFWQRISAVTLEHQEEKDKKQLLDIRVQLSSEAAPSEPPSGRSSPWQVLSPPGRPTQGPMPSRAMCETPRAATPWRRSCDPVPSDCLLGSMASRSARENPCLIFLCLATQTATFCTHSRATWTYAAPAPPSAA